MQLNTANRTRVSGEIAFSKNSKSIRITNYVKSDRVISTKNGDSVFINAILVTSDDLTRGSFLIDDNNNIFKIETKKNYNVYFNYGLREWQS